MSGAMARRSRSAKARPAVKSSSTANIGSFARVSKRTTAGKLAIGKQAVESIVAAKAKESAIEIVLPPRLPTVSATKKRKAEAAIDPEEAFLVNSSKSAATSPSSTRAIKKPRRQAEARQQVDVCGTQQAGALFERLNLQSSPSSRSSSPFTSRTSITSACDSDIEVDCQLPQDLVDLVQLHTAFLKTVSIYIAHNGTSVPIDVRSICPSIARAWGKRKVTLLDIQRCIGVQDVKPRSIFDTSDTKAPLFLADYGRGKICVELHQHATALTISEAKFTQTFEKNLRAAWSASSSSDIQQFLATLPTATIKTADSVAKVAPMAALRQRTLEELKNGIVMKKQDEGTKAKEAIPIVHADGSKMSLLDRIRYRQLQQSQEAAPPTAAELERRAALHRVGDIADVIIMLTTLTARGQKRVSFGMGAILSKLKDSLRVPISKEEGAACVRLLAKELVPQWLKVVTIGGKENVVVSMDFTPTKAAVQERVKTVS